MHISEFLAHIFAKPSNKFSKKFPKKAENFFKNRNYTIVKICQILSGENMD